MFDKYLSLLYIIIIINVIGHENAICERLRFSRDGRITLNVDDDLPEYQLQTIFLTFVFNILKTKYSNTVVLIEIQIAT